MRNKLLHIISAAALAAVCSHAQVTNLWNDSAPVGGTMNLTTLNVGGDNADVGAFDSSTTTTNVTTYSSGSADWSEFAGLDWTFTADIYITSAQLADTNISSDVISCIVGGEEVGNLTLSDAIWWTPDAWNTVYFTGSFDTDVSNLANTSAAFVNNDAQTNSPSSGGNYLLDNLNLDVQLKETKWEDNAPAGGNMALTSIPDPFGTGRGDIGAFNSQAQSGQYQNYNSGAINLEAYAGKKWKFSFEVYITAAQLADATIGDDNLYYSVGGTAGGFTTVSNAGWVADSWNPVVWAGTLSSNPEDLTSALASFLVNDQGTHPGDVNFYVDNFKFEVESATALPTDLLWQDTAPVDGGMALIATNVGGAYGDAGEFSSSAVGQYSSYGTSSNDWSAYAGQGWTLSLDVYITQEQLDDPAIAEDGYFYNVNGEQGGFGSIGGLDAGWNAISLFGAFTNAPDALTNASALFVNNAQSNNPAGPNYIVDNFRFEAVTPLVEVEVDTLWSDDAPVGGDAQFVQIADPFGTGQGSIGMFDSSANPNQYSNYNINHVDWGAYVGKDWTLSADVYITAVQLADAAINDDVIYYNVGGVQGGETSVSVLMADEWNTLTWTGTFTNEPLALADAGCLFLNNDNGTDPVAGVNYFIDNIRLEAVAPVVTNPPPPTLPITNTIEFVSSGEGFIDGALNGQNDWAASANWTVDTTSGGSVSCTNDNSNMTLVKVQPLVEGATFRFTVNLKVDGSHVPAGFVYVGRIGMTTDSDGSNQGYNGGANDPAPNWAQSTFQANNTAAYTYRVYGDGWNGPQTAFITGNDSNDVWAIHYSITMAEDPLDTDFQVDLENLTTAELQLMSGVEEGVGEPLHTALGNGTAYLYFETGGFGSGLTGVEVLSVEVTYPEPQVDKYILWANAEGLSGANADVDADPDQDGLNNLGEYVFDGNPRAFFGDNDQGTQPVLDGFTYRYNVIGDPFVVAKVLTTEDLTLGWTVSDTVNISADDGELSEYTFDASGYDNVFLKLEIDREL